MWSVSSVLTFILTVNQEFWNEGEKKKKQHSSLLDKKWHFVPVIEFSLNNALLTEMVSMRMFFLSTT